MFFINRSYELPPEEDFKANVAPRMWEGEGAVPLWHTDLSGDGGSEFTCIIGWSLKDVLS